VLFGVIGQVSPMTRALRAVSMTSLVMTAKLLIFMTRATWG